MTAPSVTDVGFDPTNGFGVFRPSRRGSLRYLLFILSNDCPTTAPAALPRAGPVGPLRWDRDVGRIAGGGGEDRNRPTAVPDLVAARLYGILTPRRAAIRGRAQYAWLGCVRWLIMISGSSRC